MAVPSDLKPAGVDFWDAKESLFVLPLPSMKPRERKAIWSSVTRMIKKRLLERKGIRIPTLGCIEVVHIQVQVGSRTLVLPMPMFYMARNLLLAQSLREKESQMAPKPPDTLKYADVARATKLSRQKVEFLILRTTSLMYHCLEKAANIAFILPDVGVIYIEGSKGLLRLYPQFLEQMAGWRFQGPTRRCLEELGLVISPELPIAALSPTRRLILFPSFEQTCVPKPPPVDPHKYLLPGPEVIMRTRLDLAPPGRIWEGRFPIVPVPPRPCPHAWPGLQTEIMGDEMSNRQLPPSPGAVDGEEHSGSDQTKDKSVPKGKVTKQSDKEAAAAQRDVGGRGENKDSLRREGEKKAQSRKEIPSLEGTPGREGEKKTRQGKGGERRESLGKGGERRSSLGKGEERRASLGKERERERKGSLGREGERRDSLGREGKKKVGRGKEKEAKDAAGSKGEQKVSPKRGEKGVSPRRNGPKEISLRRKGEKEVSPRKKEGKKAPIGRLGVRSLLERQEMKYIMEKVREKRHLHGQEGGGKAAAGSTVLPWNALPRKKPLDAKVFVLQPPEAAAQALRARPEAFWSVLKDPQKSILAGYRFSSCGMLPPVPHQGSRAPKKRDTVSQGPWPWVQ